MATYFTEFFGVKRSDLRKYGAFNISLVTDLPLFIDPFLLFNSKDQKYKKLHDEMISYLKFLRDKAKEGTTSPGLLSAWYRFPEVKQTWLGLTTTGNTGSGLGSGFATALNENLSKIFSNFGKEQVTRGSHLEKLCLISDGIGKDRISDFTANLIKGYLCEYTQTFAQKHLKKEQRKTIPVPKVRFNYDTESWEPVEFDLPWVNDDYVLLTPRDILTKNDTWINKGDLAKDFERLPDAIPNEELRAQVDNYFKKALGLRRDEDPTKKEIQKAAIETILKFPELIDVYIRDKENRGDQAVNVSNELVEHSDQLYVQQGRELQELLNSLTGFYKVAGNTYAEAHQRLAYLKDVIENKGGHRLFYVKGEAVEREQDLQIMYRLTWLGTPSDVSQEVNDGRGPADFKISRGSKDKTIVELKLASNSQLKRNLENQVEIYKKASDAKKSIKVILFFTENELDRVTQILRELGLSNNKDVILIDARKDNKPSGSKA